MPDQIADDVVADRYTRLHNHQQAISLSVNQEAIGTQHKILVGITKVVAMKPNRD